MRQAKAGVASMLQRPVAPVLVAWLVGIGALTVMGVESLFSTPHIAFVYAKLTAYISAVLIAAMTVAAAMVFAVGCGVALWWLDDPVAAQRIAVCTGRSFWCIAIYTWIAVGLLAVDPPTAVAVADLQQPELVEARMNAAPAYWWLAKARIASVAAFLIAMVILLRRDAKLVNAAIAVALGAGLVAALLAGLGALGGAEDF